MAQVRSFSYQGKLSSSKSLMNRCLIVQSYYPELKIKGESQCDDVALLKAAIDDLNIHNKTKFYCGSGGTTFRFLLARLAVEYGDFIIKADPRLLERPHQPLYDNLKAMGAKIDVFDDHIVLAGEGWDTRKPLKMDMKISSQFISALLLSAWELENPLTIHIGEERNSFSYLNMTIELLKSLGMDIQFDGRTITVPDEQQIQQTEYQVEPDMSSAFTLACLALTSGDLKLEGMPRVSLQPDSLFVEILNQVCEEFKGVDTSGVLQVQKNQNLKPISYNLTNAPDLFPVLAVLLSRVQGKSELTGLELLSHKESDRLEGVKELLTRLGFKVHKTSSTFTIEGHKEHQYPESFSFDPDQDHRMVMAATLAFYQGADIQIEDPQVVSKSFPDFWKILAS